MTTYLFERVHDGAPVEWDFPMGKAPSLGDTVELEGHGPCRRVPCFHQVSPTRDVAHVAWQMPPWVKGAPRHDKDPSSPSYGQPIFHNQKEIERFQKDNPEWQHDAAPAQAERRPTDGKAHIDKHIPRVVIEGRPKGAAPRRRRGPKKGLL